MYVFICIICLFCCMKCNRYSFGEATPRHISANGLSLSTYIYLHKPWLGLFAVRRQKHWMTIVMLWHKNLFQCVQTILAGLVSSSKMNKNMQSKWFWLEVKQGECKCIAFPDWVKKNGKIYDLKDNNHKPCRLEAGDFFCLFEI